ncbi:SGNH hydrolase [Pterulicium gracile]|uniref:SGNH hydrolase n=1 Tax=Pterulicium gracile TaxID=1884261 RepID=A0A5C3QRP4_9AGAR|nr:SGNH hydrolase [Pterula gracilis]
MHSSCLISLALTFGALAAPGPTSFVLIGDSTTANGTSLNSGGWGNGFCASLSSGTPCINTARNGASTGSFVANGFWDAAIAAIKAEVGVGRRTLATIQFGHNDQKIAGPESMGKNLTSMVQQIRALGGEPVLLTSLTRRSFNSDGTINDTLQPWATETMTVASQTQTRLLDLHKTSIKYCEAIGPPYCHVLNKSPDDNTHLNEKGSTVFGRMVADLLVGSVPSTELPIITNAALSYNISHGIPSFYS